VFSVKQNSLLILFKNPQILILKNTFQEIPEILSCELGDLTMKKNIVIPFFFSLLAVSLLLNCGKKEEKVEETAAPQASAVDAKELYVTCASCHGDTGEGNGAAAAALNPKPRNFKAPEAEWKNGKTVAGVTKTLKEGIAPGMAKYDYMKDEEIAALANYVIELGSN